VRLGSEQEPQLAQAASMADHGGPTVRGQWVRARGEGDDRLNRRQGMARPPPRRFPRPLYRRYGAGLGRRTCPGRGRGRTGRLKPCDRVTSVGATRGEDGLQCTLERESSGPRRPGRRGWWATCYARACRAPALQSARAPTQP
jgi:hypothetical protein